MGCGEIFSFVKKQLIAVDIPFCKDNRNATSHAYELIRQ